MKEFAVLFKTHVWDPFIERQLERLQSICHSGDIFVFKDQTKSFHTVPSKVPVISFSERSCESLGLLVEPDGDLFWFCNDYPSYAFLDVAPNYKYYVIIEYDVLFGASLDSFVQEIMAQQLDCVAEPVRTPISEWQWTSTGVGIYGPETQLRASLFCFAVFSHKALTHLFRRRQEMGRQFARMEIKNWPTGELFMATEMENGGFTTATLSKFLDTAKYDWWPPQFEAVYSPPMRPQVVHPFLDEGRYVASLLRITPSPEDYFDMHSDLRAKLTECRSDLVQRLFLKELRGRHRHDLVTRLRDDRRRAGADLADFRFNAALGKPATQSSISQWSRRRTLAADAAGAVNGIITGGYGFHTGEDDPSWWMVDLDGDHMISEIVVHNRLDQPQRACGISIWSSRTAAYWTLLAQADQQVPFGGADGSPFRFKAAEPVIARFIRIQTAGRAMLHLDEVEVIGEPV